MVSNNQISTSFLSIFHVYAVTKTRRKLTYLANVNDKSVNANKPIDTEAYAWLAHGTLSNWQATTELTMNDERRRLYYSGRNKCYALEESDSLSPHPFKGLYT